MVGWTPDGKILYASRRYSTLPDMQLATIDSDNRVELVPLSQAAQGGFDGSGATLFFTRLAVPGQLSETLQGRHGAEPLEVRGGPEAMPLTADYAGTSKERHVVERPHLFPLRPRRNDEPVVHGRERQEPEAADQSSGLGR